MKIQSRIKILGHPIRVSCVGHALETEDCSQAVGLAHLVTNRISLSRKFDADEVAESVVAETYLHEIAHHVNTKLGLGMEEGQISGISCGLLQVIRDNRIDFLDTEDAMGKKGKGKKQKKVAPVKGGKKCK